MVGFGEREVQKDQRRMTGQFKKLGRGINIKVKYCIFKGLGIFSIIIIDLRRIWPWAADENWKARAHTGIEVGYGLPKDEMKN
jgi:hypothetical protein